MPKVGVDFFHAGTCTTASARFPAGSRDHPASWPARCAAPAHSPFCRLPLFGHPARGRRGRRIRRAPARGVAGRAAGVRPDGPADPAEPPDPPPDPAAEPSGPPPARRCPAPAMPRPAGIRAARIRAARGLPGGIGVRGAPRFPPAGPALFPGCPVLPHVRARLGVPSSPSACRARPSKARCGAPVRHLVAAGARNTSSGSCTGPRHSSGPSPRAPRPRSDPPAGRASCRAPRTRIQPRHGMAGRVLGRHCQKPPVRDHCLGLDRVSGVIMI